MCVCVYVCMCEHACMLPMCASSKTFTKACNHYYKLIFLDYVNYLYHLKLCVYAKLLYMCTCDHVCVHHPYKYTKSKHLLCKFYS